MNIVLKAQWVARAYPEILDCLVINVKDEHAVILELKKKKLIRVPLHELINVEIPYGQEVYPL